MKSILTSLIAILSFAMVSCSVNDDLNTYSEESMNTKAIYNFNDSAYVRIGMCNALADYDIEVESMWIATEMNPIVAPTFGKNIANTGILPNGTKQAIYDQKDGRYNNVIPTGEGNDLIIHLNLTLIGHDNVGGKINLDNVTIVISADQTKWEEGQKYDYVIALTPEALNLNPIVFSAIVEDFENEVDIEFNI